ncbi:hypothetical protein H1R20_g1182, partial [Candolleomyces eurysporus]
MSSYADFQTVEELLPFTDSVEKKALPEVIGFLNHCLTAAPQWIAKDTDLMKARRLLLSPMAPARGAIDTAKKCCPRVEAWVAILVQHDDWISDPKAPLDLSVFSNPEPLPVDPQTGDFETDSAQGTDPKNTDTRDGGEHVEQKKQEGTAKGRDFWHGGEPMNLDAPKPEEFGGKKRRTPIVSDDEMEPLEQEVPTKRQKTDLETFRRVGGVAGHELGQGGDVPGEPKLAKGKARAQAKKQQPQKLEMMKVYDPPCQTCARRKVECSTWFENQACTECSKSKLKCQYAKGGAGDGEEDELELEAEESKPKPKTKLPARKSENQSAKGHSRVSKGPAKRAPKAKHQSTGGNVGSDSYCESKCDNEMEKRPKAAKEQGKGQVKKQASGEANRKAPGKSNGSGQLSTSKESGKTTKDQAENIIDLKLAKMTKNGGQEGVGAAGNGMVVDSKELEAIVHQKISWFLLERMEEAVNKRVDEIVGKELEELMERLSSLKAQMAEDNSSKELSERLGGFETQLRSMANREETSGEGLALANSLKALEELI